MYSVDPWCRVPLWGQVPSQALCLPPQKPVKQRCLLTVPSPAFNRLNLLLENASHFKSPLDKPRCFNPTAELETFCLTNLNLDLGEPAEKKRKCSFIWEQPIFVDDQVGNVWFFYRLAIRGQVGFVAHQGQDCFVACAQIRSCQKCWEESVERTSDET